MNSECNDWSEASQHKLIRPQLAPVDSSYDEWITHESNDWQRRSVINLVRYLCLETTNCRQALESSAVAWEKDQTTAMSITDDIEMDDGSARNALVGILIFLRFDANPILYYCYLHPFYRGQGKMTTAWNKAKGKFDRFEIEPPKSKAMIAFLKSVNCSHVLEST